MQRNVAQFSSDHDERRKPSLSDFWFADSSSKSARMVMMLLNNFWKSLDAQILRNIFIENPASLFAAISILNKKWSELWVTVVQGKEGVRTVSYMLTWAHAWSEWEEKKPNRPSLKEFLEGLTPGTRAYKLASILYPKFWTIVQKYEINDVLNESTPSAQVNRNTLTGWVFDLKKHIEENFPDLEIVTSEGYGICKKSEWMRGNHFQWAHHRTRWRGRTWVAAPADIEDKVAWVEEQVAKVISSVSWSLRKLWIFDPDSRMYKIAALLLSNIGSPVDAEVFRQVFHDVPIQNFYSTITQLKERMRIHGYSIVGQKEGNKVKTYTLKNYEEGDDIEDVDESSKSKGGLWLFSLSRVAKVSSLISVSRKSHYSFELTLKENKYKLKFTTDEEEILELFVLLLNPLSFIQGQLLSSIALDMIYSKPKSVGENIKKLNEKLQSAQVQILTLDEDGRRFEIGWDFYLKPATFVPLT